jgi:fatty-acyl-CoA synthase
MSDTQRSETMSAALDRTFAQYRDRPAIVDAEAEYTFGELQAAAEPHERALLGLGIEKGDRVAILLPNGVEWLYLVSAAARAGAIVVPVNNRLRPNEIETLFNSAKPRLLFMADEFMGNNFLERIGSLVPELVDSEPGKWRSERFPFLEQVVAMSEGRLRGMIPREEYLAAGDTVPDQAVAESQATVGPRDPLYIFYTSGSTGEPKGVIVPNDTVVNLQAYYDAIGLTHEDRVMIPMPLSYIGGHFMGFLGPLLNGSMAVIAHRFDVDESIEVIKKYNITFFGTTPPIFTQMVHHPVMEDDNLSELELAFVAGSSFTLAQLESWKEGLGLRRFGGGYGMTETLGGASVTLPGDSLEIVGSTIGKPLSCFEFQLRDPDTRHVVELGEPGELWVRGKIMLRYQNMDDDEWHQYVDDEGWFQTGDMLRERADGYYEYVVRIKEMIKVGGENASAPQVEAELNRHPEIIDSAAIGVADELRGEVICAFLQRVDGSTLTDDELRAWCKDRMAPFKVPRHIVWIDSADNWPRTAAGKTAKPELRKRFENQA